MIKTGKCPCVARHSPASPTTEVHHSPPTSYALREGGQRIEIELCSNAHGIQHRLLNEYRATNGRPPLWGYSAFHREMAARAWSQTDTTKPIPRTAAHE